MTRVYALLLCVFMLPACSGGGGGSGASGSSSGAVIGPAGGTVNGPGGASVVIPPGALTTETTINIEASSAGAPVLPSGFVSYGTMYAFTPHGLQFAQPVTLTVPFDPAAVPSGTTPTLYKTNAANHWQAVANATVVGSTISGPVTSFSYANAGTAAPLVLTSINRYWEFMKFGRFGPVLAKPGQSQAGGIVNDEYDFGRMPIRPIGEGENAVAEVFANDSGHTYWVSAKAPPPGSEFHGSSTSLTQIQWFEKRRENASLKIIISRVLLEAIDIDGAPEPTEQECPFRRPGVSLLDSCGRMSLWPLVSYDVSVHASLAGQFEQPLVLRTGGVAEMSGWQDTWDHKVTTSSFATIPFWNRASFVSESDGAGHARVKLRSPIVIDVPLSSLQVGDKLKVEAFAYASASNRRIGEIQYVGAYFRDPAKIDAMAFSFDGVEPIAASGDPIPPTDPAPAPVCPTGFDPAAGILEFESDSFLFPELPEQGASIVVTRSGGSLGAVSVLLSTGDDTGIAGIDYTPVTTHVLFADGEAGSRAVTVPILDNVAATADKTVRLALSNIGGCTQLGARTTATLTILDDDTTAPAYAVGGTVSGLVGSGLVLEEVVTGSRVTPSNGAFVFNYGYSSGSSYDVRIVTQPTSPAQICTLANPTGTIANANVNNVAISCSTPAANGALDSSFGSGGKVTSALVSSVSGNVGRAVALQSIGPNAGKIVVLANMALMRFHPDGRVDASFGSSGVVPVVFAGTLNNETSDLAIDANDRIIVAGWTRASNTTLNYDFAINRYDTNGILDPTFDGDGRVTIDFFGDVDRAHRVAIDSSGRIVVAGQTTYLLPPPNPLAERDTSFVVTRLNTDGTRDNSLLSALAFPDYSIPYGLAISPTGKIVLGGSTAANGTAVSDAALARFGVDGLLDSDNDGDPSVWFGVDASGRGADDLLYATNDQIVDLVVTGDNRIVGAVRTPNVNMSNPYTGANFKYNFLLVEFQDSFGDAAGQGADIYYTEVPIGLGDDRANALALQGDGKFVVAGGASSTVSNDTDFGIVRFNTDRTVDTAFGSNGILAVDFFGGVDEAKDVVVQPDGKLVVVGTVRNGSSWNLGLTRIVP